MSTDPNHMRAGIELTSLQLVRGHGPCTYWTQMMVDATRALIEGGGKGDWKYIPDRDVQRYIFVGPPELVRPVIAAFMAFIHETEREQEAS